MTDAEELELLELEKERAMANVPRPLYTGKEERAAEDKRLVESMGPMERFAIGAGQGLMSVGRNVADIAGHIPGLGGLRPDRQEWADSDALVKPVTDTAAGGIGEIAGETAPGLLLGGVAGAGVKAALGRALPQAMRVVPALARAPRLVKAMSAIPTLMAEGAAPGAVLGGPENRAEGAKAGALLNLGFAGAGKVLGAGRRFFGGKVAQAEAKAAEAAAREAAEATAKARSAAGHDAQALYRTLEHLRELQHRATPEALQELEALAARGIRPETIEAQLYGKSAAKLGADVAAARASAGEYAKAAGSEGARAAEKYGEKVKSSLLKDAGSLFTSYAEPIVGAALGTALDKQFGTGTALGTAGGLIFARTRAGKAIRNRLAKPGNQILLNKAAAAPFWLGEKLLGGRYGQRGFAPAEFIPEGQLAPELVPAMADTDETDPGMLARAEALRRRGAINAP